MRHRSRRARGFLAIVCLVVLVAAAMAPIASHADCAVLVELPAVFASVVTLPIPAPEPPRVRTVLDASPRPLRAPPVL